MGNVAIANHSEDRGANEPHQLDSSLGFLVNSVARTMRLALEERLRRFNITTTQWLVLQGIEELGEARQTDLGKKVELDDATITRQIDRLAQAGMIRREQAADDRRTQIVRLTAKGRRSLPVLNQAAHEINLLASKGVRRAKTRSLHLDLIRIRENLQNTNSL